MSGDRPRLLDVCHRAVEPRRVLRSPPTLIVWESSVWESALACVAWEMHGRYTGSQMHARRRRVGVGARVRHPLDAIEAIEGNQRSLALALGDPVEAAHHARALVSHRL